MIETVTFPCRRLDIDALEAQLRTLQRARVLFERDSRFTEQSDDGAAVRRTHAELAPIVARVERLLEGMTR